MSSRSADPAPRAGFTLLEALVALVVAGLLLPTLSRALAEAWSASRAPAEVVSAMELARVVAMATDRGTAGARDAGFAVTRSSMPLEVRDLPSKVAPAPRGTGGHEGDGQGLDPTATPSAMRLAIPKGLGSPAPGATGAGLALWRVSVVVRAPSGRRLTFDGVRLDDATR